MNQIRRASAYCAVGATNPRFASAQSETCEAIWETESKFDLIFRTDSGICLWPSHRMRHYYDLIDQRGVYSLTNQKRHQPSAVSAESLISAARAFLADVPQIDAFIMTSATSKAADNRKHPYGCIYLKDFCKELLEDGRRVLLVTNAPEVVVDHKNLFVLRVGELQNIIRLIGKELAPAKAPAFKGGNRDFWNEVSDHLETALGVDLSLGESTERLLGVWRNQFNAYGYLFDHLNPKIYMTINHYGFAPLIQAAKDRGITVIEFQHGNIGRYHLGYSFPNIRKSDRIVPYFPEEFWSWGEFWADPDWFPSRACRVKVVGHHNLKGDRPGAASRSERSDILVISTWALQELYIEATEAISRKLPDRRIVFKCHPMERDDVPRTRLEGLGNVEVVSGEHQLDGFFHRAEYAVSCSSTGLFEAIKGGCVPIVLQGPSAEYMIDFCEKFGLQMLTPDASNLEECMTVAGRDQDAMQAVVEDYDAERLGSAVLSAVRSGDERRRAVGQDPDSRAMGEPGTQQKAAPSDHLMKTTSRISWNVTRFGPVQMVLRRLVRNHHVMQLLVEETRKDSNRLAALVSLISRTKEVKRGILNDEAMLMSFVRRLKSHPDKLERLAIRALRRKKLRAKILRKQSIAKLLMEDLSHDIDQDKYSDNAITKQKASSERARKEILKEKDAASRLLVSFGKVGRKDRTADDPLSFLELALSYDPDNREALIKCLSWTSPNGNAERAKRVAARYSGADSELTRAAHFLLAERSVKGSAALEECRETDARAFEGHSHLRCEFHFRMLERIMHEGLLDRAQRSAMDLIAAGCFNRRDLLAIHTLVLRLYYREDREAAVTIFDAIIHALSEQASRRHLFALLFESACLLGKKEELAAAAGMTLDRDAPDWRQGLSLFKHLAAGGTSSPFPLEAANALEALADHSARTYLNIRVDRTEERDLFGFLLEQIRTGTPCSMIRLGDAEAFGFETDRVGQAVLAADRERRARIWWGHSVADEQVYRSVASPFVDAVMDADLLGVPNIFRLLRDMELVGDKGSLEELSTTARSLVIIFDSLKRHVREKRLTIEAKVLVDERCHERLFSPDNTRKFIAAAERTVVISCYSQDNISAGLEAPIDAHIEIPPHNQIRSRLGKDDPSEPSMLQDFPRLLADVERRIKPGDLVLVAAGFLGKILIHAAKKKGGVALDCGAAADYWVGMKTRLSSDFIWR